jgi:hypothetical protein
MKSTQSSANARWDDPCYDSFFGFGNHIYNGTLKEFAGTTKCKERGGLPVFMSELRRILRREFPLELATIVSTWESVGATPPESMAGVNRVSLAMNASLNLANAPHYNTNDVGLSATIWTEDIPGTASHWYFMLPNLVVQVAGRTYHGVMVRLSHGL